jgi:predicted Rossmann-fold nucleotide-binding protein
MEEFFEMATWGQLGLHRKPSALLNVNGFYDHLIAQLNFMNQEELLKDKYLEMILIDNQIESLLEKMETYKPPKVEKWLEESES